LAGYGWLYIMRSNIMIDVSAQIDSNINHELFNGLFRDAVLQRGAGSQPIRDLEMVRSVISGHALLAVFDLPWSPLFISLIYIMHPMLGAVALLGAVATVVLAFVAQRLTQPMIKEVAHQQSKAFLFVESCLRNVDAIHAMGMAPNIRRRWLADYRKSVNTGAYNAAQVSGFSGTSRAMRIILQSAILGCGAWLVLTGDVSAGVMVAASIIFGRAIGPLEQSIAASKGLIAARLALQRIDALLNNHANQIKPMPLPAPIGSIQVEDLAIVPPGANKILLQGVSFALGKGETLAIVGPSASGKSSLARVLVGLWKPARGKIQFDGADISQWDPVALGEHIGFLPQDVELLVGNVRENISRFGDSNPEAIIEAANKSECHSMILKLSEGYDTQIGESGKSLSAGQCQRIALARCFYGNPVFVVLDEPDSNLDVEGVIALDKALADIKKRKVTAIIITHNLKLLRHADKAMLLSNGSMAYLGTPGDLIEKLRQGKKQ